MTPMPTFWISAIGLLALALVLVLPSLLRSRTPEPAGSGAQRANLSILRDQLAQLDAERAAGSITGEQQAQAKADIERRALDEEDGAQAPANNAHAARTTRPVRTAVLVGLGIPLLALGMYGFLGNPQALQPNLAGAAPEGEITTAQIEAMVAQMAQRLENQPADQPADPKAWEMLARSYAAMQRFPEADKAYKRATALAPTNAQLLADHADVLAMLQNQSAQGEPTRLIERALQLDPKNLKALALAGSAAFERKDFTQAVDYWTRARQLAPAGSDFASGLDRSLEDARAASGTPVKTAPVANTAGSASPAAAGAASAGASSAASIRARSAYHQH